MVGVGCDADGNLKEDRFTEPLPWIGVYVAAASLLCGIMMGADLIYGFSVRKIWFPNKFFYLNATTLTLIAVALKLSVDLNTGMPSRDDQLAKLSSTAFISTVICNSMPSLGSMVNKDLAMNMMALGILVVTVIVNICIQLGTGAVFVFQIEHVIIMILMLLMFMLSSCSALTVPTTKRILEYKFKKKYEVAMKESSCETARISIPRLKRDLTKFWVMAYTSTPQFVMGRSVTCMASCSLCLLNAATLGVAILRSYLVPGSERFCNGKSDYKWSTFLVLATQTLAVVLGTVAPAIRWVAAVNLRCPTMENMRCRKEFKVESYWIQSLTESKDSPLSIPIKNHLMRKHAHDVKRLVLDLCIATQCGVVLGSKVLRFVSVYSVSRVLLCCAFCRRIMKQTHKTLSNNESETELDSKSKPDLSHFVLHLEGEDALVEVMMKSNRDAVDHWIERSRRNQPEHLIKLLELTPLSDGFRRIKDFDSYHIPSLQAEETLNHIPSFQTQELPNYVPSIQTEEPPNSWALSLATLTSIALAIPNSNTSLTKKLLTGVDEGLFYVREIEKCLDSDDKRVNIRSAADLVWLGVDLYRKWLDVDLRKLSMQGRSNHEILQELADIAKKKFFESEHIKMNICFKQSPLVWPLKTLAANAMYRTCQTMLLNYEGRDYERSPGLLHALQAIICDIFCACLTNLPRVIFIKCFTSAVEKRKLVIRDAVLDLGRTEKIMEILDKRGIPNLSAQQMACIDEWRRFYETDRPQSTALSLSEKDECSSASHNLQICIG